MSKWGTLLAAIALFSSAAWADPGVSARNKLVELTGTTKDALGRPLANVDLELSASNGRLIARAHSDRRGLFTFSNVPAGVYALLARHTDFKPNTTIVSIGRLKGEVEIYLEGARAAEHGVAHAAAQPSAQ
jgi:hypothetical protein